MAIRTVSPKARERLSRERVVAAALTVMDAEGLEAVSMRRVGRELGVEAMSLYNHVTDKEDLLDGLRELLFCNFALPPLDDDDPFENGRRLAVAWRDLFKAHPHMLELMAEPHNPPTSLDSFRSMDSSLAVLRAMGVPPEEVVQVFHAFGGYIQGFVMMEHQMDFAKFGDEASLRDLAQRIDAADLPCIAAALPYMANVDLDTQFAVGLDLMLGGLRARYSAAT